VCACHGMASPSTEHQPRVPSPIAAGALSARAIVIELQNRTVPPLRNTSGCPDAFPRLRATRVLDNNRVVVWDYAWIPGQPTPMHFQD